MAMAVCTPGHGLARNESEKTSIATGAASPSRGADRNVVSDPGTRSTRTH